ncbi:MAG: hypothetical protein K2H23_02110, partial [Oscillospiraceae bacterium]|nr:hypothetical protein [Oscillospiraceae bacterium]
MPNNDKKYTLDDILAEYEDTSVNSLDSSDSSDDVFSESSAHVNDDAFSDAASEEQSAESPQIEEYDNYEDCSEQDISADFSIEPMFAPADVFPDAEDEEIFSDEDESDLEATENEETEELVEDITVTSETSEPEITEIDVPQFIGDEFQTDESFDSSVKDWSAAGIAEEIEIPVVDTEISEDTEAEENEDSPETLSADTETDTEDVNDKWIVRALKAIFPVKGDSVGEVIRKIIFIVAVVVFIGAGIMLVSTLIQSKQAVDIQESNKSVIVTTLATSINEKGEVVTVLPTEEEKAQHNFDVAEYYKGINEDYVGYLEVAGCDIHEPVVQGEDND